ncbi:MULTISPECIES: phycobilisome protein [unclassified Chamaesiphon]|uniref:phycobilisome protein n=1 Tax=unclassified Chamaesiphon TaxID=2620921 RepID=UPI00286CB0F1|nr:MULTISPECIES: phycobilisome protein [unclassified Chamaesiphon]
MITLLEALVDGADGAYASKQDLRNLEHAMFSWSERKEAYLALQEREKSVIDRAIALMQPKKAAPGARAMDGAYLDRCRRDMTLTLRSYALAMLLQDEEMLKDRFLYWQRNILQSMGLHNYKGIEYLLESICAELPKEQSSLFQPYFKLGQETIVSMN